MPTLREQIALDAAAILGNTAEFAEELEFAGETVTGMIDHAEKTLPSGGDYPAQAKSETILYLPAGALADPPNIGAVTTLNGAEVQVIDRVDELDGMLIYTLQ